MRRYDDLDRSIDKLIEQERARRGRLVRILARWIGGAIIVAGAVIGLLVFGMWLGGVL